MAEVDFVHDPHPHTEKRKLKAPPTVADERVGFNGRLAAWITKHVGSMWVVYFTIGFISLWMIVATWGPLHRVDPYPFAFLLFLGNVVQLLLVFIILVGQQVLGITADKRAVATFNDAEAILHEVEQLHRHLESQDRILNRGISLVESQPHPWIQKRRAVAPPRVADHHIGINGQIAAFLTRTVGTMWAFYVAAIGQFGWMGLSLVGLIKFDPYPFAFLLFISSLLQLIFMFVIMVGQDVLGQAGDHRAQQTFLDAEAVLHECARLQHHLTAQDKVIVKICGYVQEHAPDHHPVKAPEPTVVKRAPAAG
ncbi:MAG TPA: DUF1003 domain-containing protein [Candidatus Dormibacteraeota bacterium]